MKIHTKISMRFVLVLIFFLLIPQQISARGSHLSIGVGFAVAGAALLGISGLIALSGCFTESDEVLLNRAERNYNDAYSRYNDVVCWFEQKIGAHRITSTERERILTNWSESVLYELATKIWMMNEYQSTYYNNVSSAVTRLQSDRNSLLQRVRKLEDSGRYDYATRNTLQRMRQVIQTVESFMPHFGLFCNFLEHHRSYFKIFETEGMIRNTYPHELTILAQYRDRCSIEQEIGYCILQKYSGQYSFLKYVEQLENDIYKLRSCLCHPAYNYVNRISSARELFDSLSYIKSIIAANYRYQQEIREKNHELLERERIQVMKEQTCINRKKARALKRKNQLKEREISLKERKYYYGDSECDFEANVTIRL